jgi:hypothetical protein
VLTEPSHQAVCNSDVQGPGMTSEYVDKVPTLFAHDRGSSTPPQRQLRSE